MPAQTPVPEVGGETGAGHPPEAIGVLAPKISKCRPRAVSAEATVRAPISSSWTRRLSERLPEMRTGQMVSCLAI